VCARKSAEYFQEIGIMADMGGKGWMREIKGLDERGERQMRGRGGAGRTGKYMRGYV